MRTRAAFITASALLSVAIVVAGCGTSGTTAAPSVNGYQVVTNTTALDQTALKLDYAQCPEGKVVLGGGVVHNSSGNISLSLHDSGLPEYGAGFNNTQWYAGATAVPDGVNWSLTVEAICASTA